MQSQQKRAQLQRAVACFTSAAQSRAFQAWLSRTQHAQLKQQQLQRAAACFMHLGARRAFAAWQDAVAQKGLKQELLHRAGARLLHSTLAKVGQDPQVLTCLTSLLMYCQPARDWRQAGMRCCIKSSCPTCR